MKKSISFGVLLTTLMFGLVSCAGNNLEKKVESRETVSDEIAEKNGDLSKDDAEEMIFNKLTFEEKQKYTVDFIREEGTKYYIRVYDNSSGEIKVKKIYTIDYHTKEIKKIGFKQQ
ncbi:hypothetical protein [Guptibacillus algicola]|uniref:hypothetical protein n=1 Tax=Guptibacillus algicola TaxID=225844 RepID=UPI001CD36C10|nr:hypothetical protein [Alkalihalobacillus algicola]MCA0985684.1 hypothetical protein [Alkalihalobacillus algicola]